MQHDFAILPWEYRGADFDPAPHATASLDCRGQKRAFLLKMRDGVIYFKEPKRPLTFTILHQFDREMRGDELVAVWRAQIEAKNFGQFSWRALIFIDCLASTLTVSAIRPDYSGWVSDAFYNNYLQTPGHHNGATLDITQTGASMGHVNWRALNQVKTKLLDRAMPESERQTIPPRWFKGNEAELQRVLSLVTRLYIRSGSQSPHKPWFFDATNPASDGGIQGYLTPSDQKHHRGLQVSPLLRPLLKVLDEHFTYVALGWNYHDDPLSPTSFLNEMSSRWGAQWRGNYSLNTPKITLEPFLVPFLSHHERLELLLELRDWLKGKVSPRQSANWLAGALD